MLQAVGDRLQALLGLGRAVEDVNAGQMALRAIVIDAFTLALVRFGSKRFLGKGTAFDVIIGIMIGSVMSRAINARPRSSRHCWAASCWSCCIGSSRYWPSIPVGSVFS